MPLMDSSSPVAAVMRKEFVTYETDNVTSKGLLRPDCDGKNQWLSPFCDVTLSKNTNSWEATQVNLNFWGFSSFSVGIANLFLFSNQIVDEVERRGIFFVDFMLRKLENVGKFSAPSLTSRKTLQSHC